MGVDISIGEYSSSLISVSPVISEVQLLDISAFSDLIMYGAIAGYFSIVIVRAVYLHDSHVKPTLIAKLANTNMLKLIQSSYEIYHNASISIVFLWIANLIILFNSSRGYSYTWIVLLSLSSSLALTTVLIMDVYREIDNIKKKPGSYNWG